MTYRTCEQPLFLQAQQQWVEAAAGRAEHRHPENQQLLRAPAQEGTQKQEEEPLPREEDKLSQYQTEKVLPTAQKYFKN